MEHGWLLSPIYPETLSSEPVRSSTANTAYLGRTQISLAGVIQMLGRPWSHWDSSKTRLVKGSIAPSAQLQAQDLTLSLGREGPPPWGP